MDHNHQADGSIIYVQAFNTETAEQLNAWFGGYEAQLNKMTDYNHDFFVHCILFLYQEEWRYRRTQENLKVQCKERRERAKKRGQNRGNMIIDEVSSECSSLSEAEASYYGSEDDISENEE
ncbi:hypothetical protein M422DRAFT_165410 [Sphaerobolus stellatus SS14]|uniref:Unplaced genomic scaffold SPHSTscaffold_33, whole genome shotgun sequence n=1 Tax=Sphaerobolus stellatus (strain SS14) TaxID=990650 RepID=A0A0C9W359_SPHS4|nr:hypothetical protein M422DRAFT_165410 [Sphaerobolus stellatus SS14]